MVINQPLNTVMGAEFLNEIFSQWSQRKMRSSTFRSLQVCMGNYSFFLLGGDSNSTGYFSGSLTVDGQSGKESMNGLTSFSSLLSSLSSI